MNNFSYADDMVILAPSMKALRKLISTCELYAIENDIIYNVKKTEYMIFKPSSMRISGRTSDHCIYMESYWNWCRKHVI